jgi:uncharacterized membrane protein YphA (DoxX/SURF4 family)
LTLAQNGTQTKSLKTKPVFIIHGFEKFDPMFAKFMTFFGITIEMQIPVALAELVSGILPIIGDLSSNFHIATCNCND